MFHLLKFAVEVLLKPYRIIDKDSCRAFLVELVLRIKTSAMKTETKLDDAILKHIELVLNNNALFEYVYRLIFDQLQTSEILFESVDEEAIAGLVESTVLKEPPSPEAIDPVLIISLVTQIMTIINTLKNR